MQKASHIWPERINTRKKPEAVQAEITELLDQIMREEETYVPPAFVAPYLTPLAMYLPPVVTYLLPLPTYLLPLYRRTSCLCCNIPAAFMATYLPTYLPPLYRRTSRLCTDVPPASVANVQNSPYHITIGDLVLQPWQRRADHERVSRLSAEVPDDQARVDAVQNLPQGSACFFSSSFILVICWSKVSVVPN